MYCTRGKDMCVCLLPSSGVVMLVHTLLPSPLPFIGLSVQPAGVQALTVIMYRVDGVRPVITSEQDEARDEKRKRADKEFQFYINII